MFPRRSEKISIEIAYGAMCRFAEAFWERGGRENSLEDFVAMISVIDNDGKPLDIAFWHDLLKAIDEEKAARGRE